MDPQTAALLTSPEALRLLSKVITEGDPLTSDPLPLDPLAKAETLRKQGYPPDLVAVVLTQARLLVRLRQRWGQLPTGFLVTPDGAEQATRPQVARHRAARYRNADCGDVVDLCCGVGVDALALARAGLSVAGFDNDPATVLIAQHNAQVLGLADRIRINERDVLSLTPRELSAAAIFADPARRQGARRVADPESWSPPLRWVLSLPTATATPNLGVKVAPGIDRRRLPKATEFDVVSVGGSVVEAGLYQGTLRSLSSGVPVSRRATVMAGGAAPATITDADLTEPAPPVGTIGEFLHEPDGAVIRAGLVGVVVQQLSGRLLDDRIAYVTNDTSLPSPLFTSYRVLDVQRFNLKKLRTSLQARAIGSVTIKKRGFAMTPEELRSALRLRGKDSGQTTLVLTRIGDVPTVVEVEALT